MNLTGNLKTLSFILLLVGQGSILGCRGQSSRSSVSPADSAAQQRVRDSMFEALVMADVRRPFPTDSQLAQRFSQHRAQFDQLVEMARADSELVRIAPDFTWTRKSVAWPRGESELGFSRSRWSQYRQLFQTLGLEAGLLQRPQDVPRVIHLLAQTKGLVTSGSVKGYAYSETELAPQCESLDWSRGPNPSGICYKPLAPNWYVYLEWD